MGNYVTATEVRQHKIAGEVVDLSMYSDAEIDVEIDLAEQLIERLTNDWFYPKDVDVILDGNGEYALFFYPEVPAKVLSLTSVEEVDEDQVTVLHTYDENDDFVKYDHYMRLFHLQGQRQNSRARVDQSGRWPRGEKNIKVVGSFGWAETPEAIKKAVKLLALERLMPGSTGIAPRDVTQASWPDFTITYRGDGAGEDTTTGFAETDRLIQPYLNPVDMFLVVPDHATLHSSSYFRE